MPELIYPAGLVCGIDEAGRGPLAGPVVAAAVILNGARPIAGLDDSKKLSEKRREGLAETIKAEAIAWAVAWATVEEIDDLNILRATLLAMARAVARLSVVPEAALVDGNIPPSLNCPVQTIVKGDASVAPIAAASILAKTSRDAEMRRLAERYPQYGLAGHMGYPTAAHLAALKANGASPIHRRSYAPVRAVLEEKKQ